MEYKISFFSFIIDFLTIYIMHVCFVACKFYNKKLLTIFWNTHCFECVSFINNQNIHQILNKINKISIYQKMIGTFFNRFSKNLHSASKFNFSSNPEAKVNLSPIQNAKLVLTDYSCLINICTSFSWSYYNQPIESML